MDLLHAPQAKVSLSSADPLWKLGQITAIPKPRKRGAAPTWAPKWVVLKGEEGRCFTNSGRSALGKDIVIKNIPREKMAATGTSSETRNVCSHEGLRELSRSPNLSWKLDHLDGKAHSLISCANLPLPLSGPRPSHL